MAAAFTYCCSADPEYCRIFFPAPFHAFVEGESALLDWGSSKESPKRSRRLQLHLLAELPLARECFFIQHLDIMGPAGSLVLKGFSIVSLLVLFSQLALFPCSL